MKKVTLVAGSLLFPGIAAAQVTDLDSLLGLISGVINALLPIIIALAVLFFLYGLVTYILSSADEGKRGEARNIMIWGVIIIFVMVSVWGLVNILVSTFGLTNTAATTPETPIVPAI